ncbi:protein of unknown function [Candidatus Nitrosocosmicus franklandus]|uniref:Uncharacterized protein n=1 Tax=Candidatus Nitrosocosmicus franklandianus TaxID=1798806 RepID=A0A484IG71_9ARCH|nr:protein of unknown function [Candidatus Nitrosocosmicus franklandus]
MECFQAIGLSLNEQSPLEIWYIIKKLNYIEIVFIITFSSLLMSF